MPNFSIHHLPKRAIADHMLLVRSDAFAYYKPEPDLPVPALLASFSTGHLVCMRDSKGVRVLINLDHDPIAPRHIGRVLDYLMKNQIFTDFETVESFVLCSILSDPSGVERSVLAVPGFKQTLNGIETCFDARNHYSPHSGFSCDGALCVFDAGSVINHPAFRLEREKSFTLPDSSERGRTFCHNTGKFL